MILRLENCFVWTRVQINLNRFSWIIKAQFNPNMKPNAVQRVMTSNIYNYLLRNMAAPSDDSWSVFNCIYMWLETGERDFSKVKTMEGWALFMHRTTASPWIHGFFTEIPIHQFKILRMGHHIYWLIFHIIFKVISSQFRRGR